MLTQNEKIEALTEILFQILVQNETDGAKIIHDAVLKLEGIVATEPEKFPFIH